MSRSAKVIATIAAIVLSLGLAAYDRWYDTPSYELTGRQVHQLVSAARLGHNGQDGFRWAVKCPDGYTFECSLASTQESNSVQSVGMGEPFGSYKSLQEEAVARGFGPRNDNKEMYIGESFTPSNDDDALYVKYDSGFVNLGQETRRSMVLRNPDTTLFGDDGTVTVDEMNRFFEDTRTELMSFEIQSRDALLGECTFQLALRGATLYTDAAEGCPSRVTVSSTDALVDVIEGQFLDF